MFDKESDTNLNIHKDFKKVFYKNEGKELSGKKRFNFWILFAILIVTFSAIGFAAGSLEYLKKKMDDPYINWFNVDLPAGNGTLGIDIANSLNQDSIAKQEFKYQIAVPYYRFLQAFKSVPDMKTMEVTGRSIGIDDPLLGELFEDKNVIKGHTFKNNEDLGIIVTKEFLEKFGYNSNVSHVLLAGVDLDNKDYTPIPIVAVVKELPDLSLFAVTTFFAVQKRLFYASNPFNRANTKGLIYFVEDDFQKTEKLQTLINNFFTENKKYKELDPYISINENNTSYRDGHNINISFISNLDVDKYDKISFEILSYLSSKKNELIRLYDIKTRNAYNENHDHLAINFYDLEKVREFKDYILKRYKLPVDVTQVEAKENYNYVSKLTLIISFILIFFSILNISMFISNILSRHLEKIKMNIGTFKAFGLKRHDLVSIYMYLILRFTLISMVLSFIVSLVFGEIGGVRFFLRLIGSNIESGEKYFDLFNWWSILTIILIITVTSVVTYFTSMRIVKQTPGDLIYNRT